VTSQAEIVFRREWGRAVAVVTRLTGDLGLAEDAVQEAFAAAVGRWASAPLPSDPSGWLITVAKNHALDRLRREARRSGKEQTAMLMLSQCAPAPPPGLIADDQLRLICPGRMRLWPRLRLRRVRWPTRCTPGRRRPCGRCTTSSWRWSTPWGLT
jgi:predicted RNA polymerase sigma factor